MDSDKFIENTIKANRKKLIEEIKNLDVKDKNKYKIDIFDQRKSGLNGKSYDACRFEMDKYTIDFFSDKDRILSLFTVCIEDKPFYKNEESIYSLNLTGLERFDSKSSQIVQCFKDIFYYNYEVTLEELAHKIYTIYELDKN